MARTKEQARKALAASGGKQSTKAVAISRLKVSRIDPKDVDYDIVPSLSRNKAYDLALGLGLKGLEVGNMSKDEYITFILSQKPHPSYESFFIKVKNKYHFTDDDKQEQTIVECVQELATKFDIRETKVVEILIQYY